MTPFDGYPGQPVEILQRRRKVKSGTLPARKIHGMIIRELTFGF